VIFPRDLALSLDPQGPEFGVPYASWLAWLREVALDIPDEKRVVRFPDWATLSS